MEVAPDALAILVRDSVDPEGPTLRCAGRAWQAFIMAAKTGNLDSIR